MRNAYLEIQLLRTREGKEDIGECVDARRGDARGGHGDGRRLGAEQRAVRGRVEGAVPVVGGSGSASGINESTDLIADAVPPRLIVSGCSVNATSFASGYSSAGGEKEYGVRRNVRPAGTCGMC